MKVLLTGGAGYIGSHTAVQLLDAGHEVTIVDNLVNSSEESIKRVEKITGNQVVFHKADVSDRTALEGIFASGSFDSVIHFAGLKAVGESVEKPLLYYRTNIDTTLTLCETMQKFGVFNLVFSSSATVYGTPQELPLLESSQTGVGITNPYGQTKFMIEQILSDLAHSDTSWNITLLRYFNPIGAHPSGLIGEDPNGLPNNLLPYVSQVAVGKLERVSIYGNDYDTVDGTGVRDFIHVVDLAEGHMKALEHMQPGVTVYNLGTGSGVSVLELIAAFEKASGVKIEHTFAPRRPGDVAACFADAAKAYQELGWKTKRTLDEACADSWRWQSENPRGYKG